VLTTCVPNVLPAILAAGVPLSSLEGLTACDFTGAKGPVPACLTERVAALTGGAPQGAAEAAAAAAAAAPPAEVAAAAVQQLPVLQRARSGPSSPPLARARAGCRRFSLPAARHQSRRCTYKRRSTGVLFPYLLHDPFHARVERATLRTFSCPPPHEANVSPPLLLPGRPMGGGL